MNPPELTDREKANLAAHNESLKFLTKFDTPEVLPLPRIAPSLLHLKRKIAAANQKYSHPQSAKTSAQIWLSDTAHIDRKSLRDQADLAKKHLSIIAKPLQKQAPNWATLEFSGVGNLQKEDFLFYNETRIAHQAVKLAVSKGEKNRALQHARVSAIYRLAGKIESEDKKDQQPASQFKLEAAVEEAVELDGKKVLQNLHTRLSVADSSSSIKLLAEQLNLLSFINETSNLDIDIKEKDRQTRNCLFIIGVKFLEKIYSKETKQQKTTDSDTWQSAYTLLRTGKIKQAAQKLQNFANISKSLLRIDDNLDKFQWLDINLIDEPSSLDNIYQSTIKRMLKGTYELRPQNGEINSLEEAWVMLMTLGLRRKGREEKKEKVEQLVALKLKIQDFYEEKMKKMRENKDMKQLTLGLISLGAFDLVLDLHKRTSRGMKVEDESEFIHIFILLVSNPALIISFFPFGNSSISDQAEQIIHSCLDLIIYFSKKLFRSRSKSFDHYLNLLTSIFSKLDTALPEFSLLPAIRTLTTEIFNHPTVLNQFSHKKLKILQSPNLSQIFFDELLRSMMLKGSREYFDLADFYRSYNQKALAHHVLSAFMINEIAQPIEQPGYIDDAQDQQKQLAQEDKRVLQDFLKILRKLKSMIALRRREDLKKTISQWSAFRRNNNQLLQLLKEMQERDGVNYTNIYLHYYEQLRPAYQAVYAITDRLSQAQQIGKILTKELVELKQAGFLSQTPELSLCFTSLAK